MAKDKPGVISQIRMNYRMTKEVDRKLPWVLLATLIFGAAVGFALFYLLAGSVWISAVGAILLGLLALMIVLARRSQRAMYIQLENSPAAAARALQLLRRGWKVDAGIAFNKNQDLVHRVVGRPGIVLVGEGNANRLRPLLASERRKHERVVAETPIHEIVVGYADGEVPLRKLVRHITKLDKALKPGQMTDVLARLRALDAQRSNIPIPKGPVPTSMKGFRGQLRGR